MPTRIMEHNGLSPFVRNSEDSSFFLEELVFLTERQVGLKKSGSGIDHHETHPQRNLGQNGLCMQREQMIGISNSWKDDDHYSSLQSDLSGLSTSAIREPKHQSGPLYDRFLSSSLSDIFVKKMQLSSSHVTFCQSRGENNLDEDEPFQSMEELEARTIGNLLPDDDDLLSGVNDDIGFAGRVNNRGDIDDDIFYSGGGMELEVDDTIDANKASELVEAANEQLSGLNGLFCGEHPFGEHPSRTLFVRNINSNVEDAELKSLFEQYGEIRTIYTACKHRGFVMISYYDIRAARNAMKSLQSKPLRRRKLDIHFSIPKDNPSEKDINQGTLVVFNLDSFVSNDDLRHIFGAYGDIKEIRETPQKHNHKFIEFYDVRSAEAALHSLNRSDIAGKKIKLESSHSGGARRLMQSPDLEQEASNGWKSGSDGRSKSGYFGSVSRGIIAPNGLENGSFDSLHSTVCAPISRPFTEATSHAISSSVSLNLSSNLRFASISGHYNQPAHADLSHSLNQFNFGVQGQGITSFHPHSLPDFHNGTTNGIPCESPNLMSPMSFDVNLRSAEEINNRFLQKVGSSTLNQYNNAIGFTGIGSFPLNGQPYVWDNSNAYHHQPPSPMSWSNLSSFVNDIPTHDQSQMHGDPRSSSLMLNTVLPLHHAGSAPQVTPLWNRRHGFGGAATDSHALLPGSLGNMRFSEIPKLHPMEIASRALPSHTIGNCIDPNPSLVAISSSQHRSQIFHGRSAMILTPSSLDGPIDRIKIRRNEANSNQADSKKQYELDIELIIRGEDSRTTLMLKNIPNKYTSKMLLAAIDENHHGTYDFFYLPIDFKNKCNVGYAFINMTKPQHIIPFYQSFNGKKWEKFNSEKVASLAYARIQGKSALITHFQNSSLMNEDKRCRPIIFHSDGPNAGDQEPFPMGLNIRSRSSRSRAANGIEEQHHGSPPTFANVEASPDAAAGSPSGPTD